MNGFKVECQREKDENGCDYSCRCENTFEELIHSLATGLLVISILAVILEYRKERNKITNDTELTDFQQRDQDMEELHEAEGKGNKIAFWQGSDNRIEKNRALIDYEVSFHGNRANGIRCIKVNTIKYKRMCLGFFL